MDYVILERYQRNLYLGYGSNGSTSDIVGYTDSGYGGDLLRRRLLICYVYLSFLVVLLVRK